MDPRHFWRPESGIRFSIFLLHVDIDMAKQPKLPIIATCTWDPVPEFSATRRHRQGKAVQLAHHGCSRNSLEALTSAVPMLEPALISNELYPLSPNARDAFLFESLTATLNEWSSIVLAASLAPQDSDTLCTKTINYCSPPSRQQSWSKGAP